MMRKVLSLPLLAAAIVLVAVTARWAHAESFSRSWLWSPNEQKMEDTLKYKKDPPYVIGFSNSSATQNSWRVYFTRQVEAAVEKNKSLIKEFYATDANDNPVKQMADIEGLLEKKIDVLILSASGVEILDPVVKMAMAKGVPVVCVDRRVSPGNYVSFVTSSNYAQGRIQMLWLAEMLKGKGNIVMLGGIEGTGPARERLQGAKEILSQYPGIKVLALKYAGWSAAKGRTIMEEMLSAYGHSINGVWGDALSTVGALEALEKANLRIPITGDHLNGFLVKVQNLKYPAMSIDFPVAMGGDAVEVALKILQGVPVPETMEAPRTVLTTQDTPSVKSDMPWSKMAHPDWPDSSWNNTLPPQMLPK